MDIQDRAPWLQGVSLDPILLKYTYEVPFVETHGAFCRIRYKKHENWATLRWRKSTADLRVVVYSRIRKYIPKWVFRNHSSSHVWLLAFNKMKPISNDIKWLWKSKILVFLTAKNNGIPKFLWLPPKTMQGRYHFHRRISHHKYYLWEK